jgi:hypothetical protein
VLRVTEVVELPDMTVMLPESATITPIEVPAVAQAPMPPLSAASPFVAVPMQTVSPMLVRAALSLTGTSPSATTEIGFDLPVGRGGDKIAMKNLSRTRRTQMRNRKLCASLSTVVLAVASAVLIAAPTALAAQTTRVIHSFQTNGTDGYQPYAGVIFDAAGNLYGTTAYGGPHPPTCGGAGCGTVFELSLNAKGNWVKKLLRSFGTAGGGVEPHGGVILDTSGNLYGTTFSGGAFGGGNVFELIRGSNGHWTEKVLQSFAANDESYAGLIRDAAGNLYGTTLYTAFELTPGTGGQWTETILHTFGAGTDGSHLHAGLVSDAGGNLYGTTYEGGTGHCGTVGCGIVFELSPGTNGQWTETILYNFQNGDDGFSPSAGLIFDSAGNLYGTAGGGHLPYGVVFKLTPSNGQWTETVLHNFNIHDGFGPAAPLIFDPEGNLYSTTVEGGSLTCSCGVVFELTPTSGGEWTEKLLHVFNGKNGELSAAGLILDTKGNLYGTTSQGGAFKGGNVFEVTP